jgi:mono/diheme cytochrome c family protein
MKQKWIMICSLGVMACLVRAATAQEQKGSDKGSSVVATAASSTATSHASHASASPQALRSSASEERAARLEGEKRFRTNCGRCHQPPHKFPPRVMATAIRHMRVRAMLTDEDMRLILRYMTQ